MAEGLGLEHKASICLFSFHSVWVGARLSAPIRVGNRAMGTVSDFVDRFLHD